MLSTMHELVKIGCKTEKYKWEKEKERTEKILKSLLLSNNNRNP